jgi:hypothetical protein
MHGGFTDIIDFEKAMLAGGADYHDTNGYGGMMGGIPENLKKEKAVPETPSTSAGSAPITNHPTTTTLAPGVIDTSIPVSATPQPTKPVVDEQVVFEGPKVTTVPAGGQCASPSEPAGENSESDCQTPGDSPKDEL